MNEFFKFFILCLCITTICLFVVIKLKPVEPKIGQIWVEVDSSDPFRPAEYDTIIVLDIKENYAKVIHNGDTTSMPTRIISYKHNLLNNLK